MVKFSCCFLLLFVVQAFCEPNAQISLTGKGLDYVNKVLINNLVSQIQGLSIPRISVSRNIELDNAVVKKVYLKGASFGVNNGLLELDIRMTYLTVSGKYKSRGWWWFNSDGEFKMNLKNLDIIQRLSIGHNSKGQPIVNTVDCTTTIQSSSYQFQRSMMLNFISNFAKQSIQAIVERKICDAVSEAIQKKAYVLPTLYNVNHRLPGIPCKMISFPITKSIVEQDYVEMLITGEVSSLCRASTLNSSSSDGQAFVRYVPNRGKMLSISFSDRLLNLVFKKYFEAGLMRWISTKIKPWKCSIVTLSAPTVNTSTNGSVMTLELKTIITKMTLKPMTAVLTNKFHVDVLFSEGKKKLTARLVNLRKETISQVDKKDLYSFQQETSEFLKKLNGMFRDFIQLPLISGLKAVNQTIIYQEGGMTLEMDINV